MGGEGEGGQNNSEDARHCSVLYICKYLVVNLFSYVLSANQSKGSFITFFVQLISIIHLFSVHMPEWSARAPPPPPFSLFILEC